MVFSSTSFPHHLHRWEPNSNQYRFQSSHQSQVIRRSGNRLGCWWPVLRRFQLQVTLTHRDSHPCHWTLNARSVSMSIPMITPVVPTCSKMGPVVMEIIYPKVTSVTANGPCPPRFTSFSSFIFVSRGNPVSSRPITDHNVSPTYMNHDGYNSSRITSLTRS